MHIRINAVAVLAASGVAIAIFTTLPAATNHYQTATQSTNAAPPLSGDAWINVPGNALASVKSFTGRVTVLHFWTFECINCKHNLPYYAKWAAAYRSAEVQVIGIHTPELLAERNPANVREAVKALGITYPVLIDGEGTNWNRYHQEYWPTVYVIDKKGTLRFKWAGELQWDGQDGYGQVTAVIERLRKE